MKERREKRIEFEVFASNLALNYSPCIFLYYMIIYIYVMTYIFVNIIQQILGSSPLVDKTIST